MSTQVVIPVSGSGRQITVRVRATSATQTGAYSTAQIVATLTWPTVTSIVSNPDPILENIPPTFTVNITNPDNYTVTRLRIINSSTGQPITDWMSAAPYIGAAIVSIPAGTLMTQVQFDTVEGGVITSSTVPFNIPDNVPPTFDNTPPLVVVAGDSYNHTVQYSDVDSPSVTLSAVSLPSWMNLIGDGLFGVPGAGDVGPAQIELALDDQSNTTVTQLTNITVLANSPPQFDNTAPSTATEDSLYSHTVLYSDQEDLVTLTAPTKPTWLSLVGDLLSGTPGAGDVGDHSLTLQLDDGINTSVTQNVTITVAPLVNTPPQFDNTAPNTATESELYSHTVQHSDPDSVEVLTAPVLPSWLTLNGDLLEGTPGPGDVGNNNLTLRLNDEVNQVDQVVVINVAAETSSSDPTPLVESYNAAMSVRLPTRMNHWQEEGFEIRRQRQSDSLVEYFSWTRRDGRVEDIFRDYWLLDDSDDVGSTLSIGESYRYSYRRVKLVPHEDEMVWRLQTDDRSAGWSAWSSYVELEVADTIFYLDPGHPNASDVNAGTDANFPLKTGKVACDKADAERDAGRSSDVIIDGINGTKLRPTLVDDPAIQNYLHVLPLAKYSTQSTGADAPMRFKGINNAIVSGALDYTGANEAAAWVDVSVANGLPVGSLWLKDWIFNFGFSKRVHDLEGEEALIRDVVMIDGQLMMNYKTEGTYNYPNQSDPAYPTSLGHTLTNCINDPGSVFVDETANEIYLHVPGSEDPNVDLVEVAVCRTVMHSAGMDNIFIKDLTFEHSNEELQNSSAIGGLVLSTDSSKFYAKNCTFRWANDQALQFLGANSRVNPASRLDWFKSEGNNASDCGGNGIACYHAVWVSQDGDTQNRNNWRGARGEFRNWSVGNKSNESKRVAIHDCHYLDNDSDNYWPDLDFEDLSIDHCYFKDGGRKGIFYESLGWPAYFRHNRLIGSASPNALITHSGAEVYCTDNIFYTGATEEMLRNSGDNNRWTEMQYDADSRYPLVAIPIISTTATTIVIADADQSIHGWFTSEWYWRPQIANSASNNGSWDMEVGTDPTWAAGELTITVDGPLTAGGASGDVTLEQNFVPRDWYMRRNVFINGKNIHSYGVPVSNHDRYLDTLDTDYNTYLDVADPATFFVTNVGEQVGTDHTGFKAFLAARGGLEKDDNNSRVMSAPGIDPYSDTIWDDLKTALQPATPAAPSLDQLDAGPGQVILQFTIPDSWDVETVEVYADSTPNATTLQQTIAWNATPFPLTWTNGVPAYVRLKAVGAQNTSAFSNEMNATPLADIIELGAGFRDSVTATGSQTHNSTIDVTGADIVVVMVAEYPNTGATYVTNVTIDGNDITGNLIANPGVKNFNQRASAYYLVNPGTGVKNWSVSIGGTAHSILLACFANVDTAAPISASAGIGYETSGDTHKDIDITPAHASTMVVLVNATRGVGYTATPDSGQTEIADVAGAGIASLHASYKVVGSPVLTTVGCTTSGEGAKGLHAFALKHD